MNISNDERINLKKLLSESDCDNNTEQIRKLKHSNLIANDINQYKKLKEENDRTINSTKEDFIEKCKIKCEFLYNHYTDIFNKLVKDELDLILLTRFLVILKMIEDGKVDQHEGSVLVGKILKEIYVDSALKRCDNLDKEHADEKKEKNDGVKMSWKEFKKISK
jgi:hypothetical protein